MSSDEAISSLSSRSSGDESLGARQANVDPPQIHNHKLQVVTTHGRGMNGAGVDLVSDAEEDVSSQVSDSSSDTEVVAEDYPDYQEQEDHVSSTRLGYCKWPPSFSQASIRAT